MAKNDYHAVVIGVSAGGFTALHTLLPMFPCDFPLPIFVVQHRMAGKDEFMIESLDSSCSMLVKEADDKEIIEYGTIYIAPGGYHLLVERNWTLSLSVDEPVSYARPSIDVLFETATRACYGSLIGVILTGANSDGSNGVAAIKNNGGVTIAQDPETAEVATMPASAIASGHIDHTMHLTKIATFITKIME